MYIYCVVTIFMYFSIVSRSFRYENAVHPSERLVSKGCFLSESEIDTSNCQTHMPNHYLKVEILKLSSITVKCCISVSVLNFIQQDVKSPNNVYLFWLLTIHLFCLLFSVLITKTALLDCMPPENVSCVLIMQAGKFK